MSVCIILILIFTDYKVGRYLFRSEYAVQADGSLMPVRWMAPESLMENHFSLQTDIWYMCVCVCVFYSVTPYYLLLTGLLVCYCGKFLLKDNFLLLNYLMVKLCKESVMSFNDYSNLFPVQIMCM